MNSFTFKGDILEFSWASLAELVLQESIPSLF